MVTKKGIPLLGIKEQAGTQVNRPAFLLLKLKVTKKGIFRCIKRAS
jgi:hypothetical protein